MINDDAPHVSKTVRYDPESYQQASTHVVDRDHGTYPRISGVYVGHESEV